MKERKFECKFCNARFVSEDRFLRHRCKQMIRDEQLRTPIGQAAWIYYQKWMKVYHRQVPRSSSFLRSKFFSSFIRFAEFVKKVHLPDPDTFIWLMKEKDISPTIWNNDQVYAIYLEFLDRKGDPKKHAEITVDTLFKVAEAGECQVGDVFEIFTPTEVIQLLRERRISPWILLNSKKFMKFFVCSSAEERIVMESIIRPNYWAEKFRKRPKDVEMMRKIVSELKL